MNTQTGNIYIPTVGRPRIFNRPLSEIVPPQYAPSQTVPPQSAPSKTVPPQSVPPQSAQSQSAQSQSAPPQPPVFKVTITPPESLPQTMVTPANYSAPQLTITPPGTFSTEIPITPPESSSIPAKRVRTPKPVSALNAGSGGLETDTTKKVRFLSPATALKPRSVSVPAPISAPASESVSASASASGSASASASATSEVSSSIPESSASMPTNRPLNYSALISPVDSSRYTPPQPIVRLRSESPDLLDYTLPPPNSNIPASGASSNNPIYIPSDPEESSSDSEKSSNNSVQSSNDSEKSLRSYNSYSTTYPSSSTDGNASEASSGPRDYRPRAMTT